MIWTSSDENSPVRVKLNVGVQVVVSPWWNIKHRTKQTERNEKKTKGVTKACAVYRQQSGEYRQLNQHNTIASKQMEGKYL